MPVAEEAGLRLRLSGPPDSTTTPTVPAPGPIDPVAPSVPAPGQGTRAIVH